MRLGSVKFELYVLKSLIVYDFEINILMFNMTPKFVNIPRLFHSSSCVYTRVFNLRLLNAFLKKLGWSAQTNVITLKRERIQ